jgi:S-methylmethionine-dependent homocysteine/selenocysteine methylase
MTDGGESKALQTRKSRRSRSDGFGTTLQIREPKMIQVRFHDSRRTGADIREKPTPRRLY